MLLRASAGHKTSWLESHEPATSASRSGSILQSNVSVLLDTNFLQGKVVCFCLAVVDDIMGCVEMSLLEEALTGTNRCEEALKLTYTQAYG